MGRNKRRNPRLPGFVALPWDVLNSAAYQEMTPTARAALPYWLGKPKAPFNKPEYFSTEFSFSYPEAAKYGFAPATFNKVIDQVVAHGFVDPVDKGGLRGHGKTCSLFRLSKRWEQYGTKNFQQMSWREFAPKNRQHFKNGNV